MDRLVSLIVMLVPLSLISFGGGQAIIADIQHQSVAVNQWMTNREFTDLFALSRSSPGPASLIVALIGFHVAGFAGALVATFAIYVPSSLLVVGATALWHWAKDSPWRSAIEHGLAPIALGLIFAGVLAVVRAAQMNVMGLVVAAVCAAILYFTKLNAYFLIFAVAALYAAMVFFPMPFFAA
ncbi:MAG TPA: chromate transporter [Xanthobacteraceae bacterium]|jgi:chromate transporter|nr:chromate transporter [Xanthobacteraceae bacterium]